MQYRKYSFTGALFFLLTCIQAQSWKEAATDSILKYRTSPLVIQVMDNDSTPLEGVTVHVKMLEHDFIWGTVVSITEISRLTGGKRDIGDNVPYFNHFRLFNSATPGNAGKWKGWIDPGLRSVYLQTIDWLENEGIANRGHTCVWESERFNAVPDMLIGQTDTALIRAKVREHIMNIMSTLSDKIYEMDVVNELVHEQAIVDGLLNAPDPALEHSKWYKWAKQAAPEVKLIANEFDLFQSGNDFYKRYIKYVQRMIDDGAPIDGVGMQGHFWTDMPAYDELKKRIEQVKPLGLPMTVTEFDMKGKSYDDMERVLYAVFSEPQIYGFTMWGAWDGNQWRDNGPVFEENWDIKPSGQAWLDLVHGKWENDTILITDESGQIEIAAYKGSHLIQVKQGDYVLVDTIEVDHSKVELTYRKEHIHSVIPTGSLSIMGNITEFNVYQPARVEFNSNYPDSILNVEFYEDLFMQHRDTAPDFYYEIVNTYAGSRQIYARVTTKKGYTFITDTVELTFVNKNAFPNILDVYPFKNQFFILGNDVTIACEASDYENQLWKAELTGYQDTIFTDTTLPFQFTLPDPPTGKHELEIKVLDSLYGFNTKKITFTVVKPEEQNISISTPTKQDDDIEELEDGSIETEGDLDMGEKRTGIRFSGVNLPAGSMIDSAFIQFTTDKTSLGIISWDIQAEFNHEANEFTMNKNDLSERINLTSPVNWNPGEWEIAGERSAVQRTPDIKTILQELVNIEDWTENSPVVIIMGTGIQDNKRRAVSYDLDPDKAPELKVYYTAQFDLTPPEAPDNLHIISKSEDELTISWNAPLDPDVLGYFVYVNGERYDVYGTESTRFTVNIPTGTAHNIYVTAINNYSQESGASNIISSDDDITKSNHQFNNANIKVYPNPFVEKVRIYTHGITGKPMVIYNQKGQIVRNLRAISIQNQMSLFVWDGVNAYGKEAPPGVYFINWKNMGENITGKIIIKR